MVLCGVVSQTSIPRIRAHGLLLGAEERLQAHVLLVMVVPVGGLLMVLMLEKVLVVVLQRWRCGGPGDWDGRRRGELPTQAPCKVLVHSICGTGIVPGHLEADHISALVLDLPCHMNMRGCRG